MNEFQQDYFGQTTLAPLGLVAIIVLGMAMLLVPRKYAAVPMIIMACFVPPAQRIAIFSLNFDLLRIMVLFGSARVFIRGEWRAFRWNVVDYMVMGYCAYALITCALVYLSADAIKNKLGFTYDAVGMYLLFRIVVREWTDIDEICRALALVSLPVLVFFLIEHSTGRNMFSALGGVREITEIRDGRLRCQGAFAHPILAGCFWASVVPLLVAQWWRKQIPRWLVVAGLFASGAIIFLCASSTPVSSVILAVPALLFFRWRRHLKVVLWSLVAITLVVQAAMSHGIWWLVTYVNIVGGSTAWFRYQLMQAAYDNLSEWWFIGSAQGTAHWGDGLVDVTNYYVVQCLQGGFILLAMFIGILAVGFNKLAHVVRGAASNRGRALMAWAIGVALLMHAANFVGVSYFGQILVIWYMQLAMIGSLFGLSTHASARSRRPVRRSKMLQATASDRRLKRQLSQRPANLLPPSTRALPPATSPPLAAGTGE